MAALDGQHLFGVLDATLRDILHRAWQARRVELTAAICTATSDTIIDGPFNGLKLARDWSHGNDLAPMLLGFTSASYTVISSRCCGFRTI